MARRGGGRGGGRGFAGMSEEQHRRISAKGGRASGGNVRNLRRGRGGGEEED